MARKGGLNRGLFERDGCWWIQWSDHRGKRHREKVGSKSAARTLYTKRKEEARQRKKLGPLRGLDKTLAEVIEKFLPLQQTKRTWRDDKRYGAYWTQELGDMPIEDLTPADFERRKARLLSGARTPATVNRYFASIRRILNLALKSGEINRNPLAAVGRLEERNVRKRILQKAELTRLLEELDSQSRALVRVALLTGMRRGNLFTLRWRDLNLDLGTVTVPDKSGRTHTFYLHPGALAALQELPQVGEWIFPSSRPSAPLDAQNWARRVFRPALRRAGIVDFRFHDLKHTYVSQALESGLDVKTVQELVGHKTLAMTAQRYSHLSPTHLRMAAARVSLLDDHQNAHRGTSNANKTS